MKTRNKIITGLLATALVMGGASVPAVEAAGVKHIYAGIGATFVTIDNKAWGSGDFLSTGIFDRYSNGFGHTNTPQEVKFQKSVKKIASGFSFSYILKTDGTVWGVGNNYNLQTGNSAVLERERTDKWAAIPGLTDVVDVAAGEDHGLALKADGTVWAWGNNNSMQLGYLDPYRLMRAVPIQVPMTDAVSIAAGENFSLVLKKDGTVWAFGSNEFGQQGSSDILVYPGSEAGVHQVQKLANVKSIHTISRHALAVLQDGTVWGWGDNGYGKLGDFSLNKQEPVQLPLTDVASAATGDNFTLLLKKDGTVWALGSNNTFGLGQGVHPDDLPGSVVPLQVPSLSGITEVAASGSVGMALAADGSVYVWGEGWCGEAGLGLSSQSDPYSLVSAQVPTKWNPLPELTATAQTVSATQINLTYDLHDYETKQYRQDVTYKVRRDSQVIYEGTNMSFSDTGLTGSNFFYTVDAYDANGNLLGRKDFWANTSSRKMLSNGDYHSLMLLEDGTLQAFGLNSNGQLGDGTKTNLLAPKTVLTGVNKGVAGYRSSLALKADGTLWAWGANGYGELGYGNTTEQLSPVQVKNLTNVTNFDTESYHGAAVTADGSVWTWGLNTNGQLATGDKTNRLAPAKSTLISGVKDVKTGYGHTVFLKTTAPSGRPAAMNTANSATAPPQSL